MQDNPVLAEAISDWVGGWASARNFDEAGTAVGKAARDVGNFIGRNVMSLFGGGSKSSGPPVNRSSYVSLNNGSAGFDFKAANNIGDTRPLIQQYNEHPRESYDKYDPTGGVLTTMGTGLVFGEYKMFNKDTWYSIKKMKTYGQHFNGNGATGGKVASALKISKGIKWTGNVLGAYNAGSIFVDYQNGEMDGVAFTLEEASNGYATFGGIYGAAWGIGWESGRWFTYRDFYQKWKRETWYPLREEKLGY